MSAKIIFIGNYKGGVGKTTSALNFGEYFAKEDKRVLVLDIDPQSSLSEILVAQNEIGSLEDLPDEETLNYIFDLNIAKMEKYPCMELNFDSSLIKHHRSGFDFVPSSLFYRNNRGLDTIALLMKDNIMYLSILKNWVDTVSENYDYILVDCPPSNNLITRSAFLMSHYYVIPTVLDGLSTNGVIHYINTVEETYDRYCGKNQEDYLLAQHFFGEMPKLIGIFYNLIRGQVNYEKAKDDFEKALDNMTQYGKNIMLDCQVNNYIAIARSTPKGEAAVEKADFKNLTQEIMKRIL